MDRPETVHRGVPGDPFSAVVVLSQLRAVVGTVSGLFGFEGSLQERRLGQVEGVAREGLGSEGYAPFF